MIRFTYVNCTSKTIMLFCVLQKAVGISVTMRYAKKLGKKIVHLADEKEIGF